MKPLVLSAVSALALSLAACQQTPPAQLGRLDCPADQGDLKRTAVAPDGRSCSYQTADGTEVTLQLAAVTGGPEQTLDRLEAGLLAQRKPAAPPAADAKPAAASKVAEAVADAEDAAREAGVDVKIAVGKDGGVVVEENGGTVTRVNLPGIKIIADEANDTAKVQIGSLSVNAEGDQATVRSRREVRLKGEQLARERRGYRAMFVYTGEDLPEGYRYIGYEAGGRKTGPLVVGLVRGKDGGPDAGEIRGDLETLVRRNAGV